jgi:hypothetical protein
MSNVKAPELLNPDGTASLATTFMMSHHAFRRDLALFRAALGELGADSARATAILAEWKNFNGALRGHHGVEDTQVFPGVRSRHEGVGDVLDRLEADHRRIDPLLDEGDRAFAALPGSARDAHAVVDRLSALLSAHLELEEAEVVPFMRTMTDFPPPPSDEIAGMYAGGFAWAMRGIAPEVLTRVNAMLPESVTSRLPAARAAYEERFRRAFGEVAVGASTTSVPGVAR